LKDQALGEAHALLQTASLLNSSLDAGTILERIVRSARDALACDWSLILLWDERRDVADAVMRDCRSRAL
jgi:hypothetical protein